MQFSFKMLFLYYFEYLLVATNSCSLFCMYSEVIRVKKVIQTCILIKNPFLLFNCCIVTLGPIPECVTPKKVVSGLRSTIWTIFFIMLCHSLVGNESNVTDHMGQKDIRTNHSTQINKSLRGDNSNDSIQKTYRHY